MDTPRNLDPEKTTAEGLFDLCAGTADYCDRSRTLSPFYSNIGLVHDGKAVRVMASYNRRSRDLVSPLFSYRREGVTLRSTATSIVEASGATEVHQTFYERDAILCVALGGTGMTFSLADQTRLKECSGGRAGAQSTFVFH